MSVDGDADPRRYVRLMDKARGGRDADPAQYRGVFDMLAAVGGERVLDVGCGTGGAVRALAAAVGNLGRVVGLDVSRTMVEEARARAADCPAPVEFVLGDAHAMPFPDGTFDAAYSLRVFEIIGDPRRVLSEMARVLRPGGRLVVNGIDMDALTIDSPDRELTRKVIHYACDVSTHGWAGRQLFGWCKELGLADVSVTPVAAVFHDFEPFYEIVLRAVVEDATAAGVVTAEEIARWLADLRERDRRGLFFYSQTFFRIAATKGGRK